MSDYSQISYESDEGIATITLNRPSARNGYTVTMSDELVRALDQADQDPDVRVVILTGAGDHFCAGADLSDGSFEADPSRDGDDAIAWHEPAGRCSIRIYEMNKPVIAAIRGAAVGAGSTIILSADYRVASDDARFGFVFSRRGIYPEGASTWFLPRLVGMGRAMDWMVSGRLISADEALRSGLVTSLHPSDAVLGRARALAAELIRFTAPVSVAVIRRMLFELSSLPSPRDVRTVDSKLIAGLTESKDAYEGVASFLDKRDPQFPGSVPADIPSWLPWVRA